MAKRRARRRGYSGPRIARGQYKFTPKRQMALRKAQMVSARKRKKGLSRNAKIGIAAGVGTAAVLGTAVARHKLSGSELSISVRKNTQPGVQHRTIRRQEGKGHPGYVFSYKGVNYRGSGREMPHYNTHNVRVGVASIGGVTLAYRHKEVTAQSAKEKLFGKKIKSGGPPPQAKPKVRPVDRDTIPHANPKSSKSWPHVGVDDSRAQNEGLREGTHYLSPTGVRRYPESAKGRAAIDEKVFRRAMGLGWTKAGETWNPYVEPGQPQRRKRRRRRKKKS